MISKAPELGKKDVALWAKELLIWIEELRFQFMLVKGLWFQAEGSDVHGGYVGKNLTAGNSAYINFVIPRETNEIKEAVLRIIPTVSGTIDWTVDLYHAGLGEDESLYTNSITDDGTPVIDDKITEIDVTEAFENVHQDDQIGLKFTIDAVSSTTDIYVLGLYFKSR